VGGERPLPGHGRRHRLTGLGEGNEEGIALGADLTAIGPGEGGPHQPPMHLQDLDVLVSQPLKQPVGPLDVGKQQRDRSGRQLDHGVPTPSGSRQAASACRLGVTVSQVSV
jgi:hypothetical protein